MVVHSDFSRSSCCEKHCRGDRVRASRDQKDFGIGSKLFPAQPQPFHRYKEGGVQRSPTRRRKSMLCQGDHVRTLVADVAWYECFLKEQSPVALGHCDATNQNCMNMRKHCSACLPQACTLPSNVTIGVLHLVQGIGRVGEKFSHLNLDKMATTHRGPSTCQAPHNCVVDVAQGQTLNKHLKSRQGRTTTSKPNKWKLPMFIP